MLIKIISIVICLAIGWLILYYGMLRYHLNNWVVLLIMSDIFILFIVSQWLYSPRLGILNVVAAGWFAAVVGLSTAFSRQHLLQYVKHVDQEEPQE